MSVKEEIIINMMSLYSLTSNEYFRNKDNVDMSRTLGVKLQDIKEINGSPIPISQDDRITYLFHLKNKFTNDFNNNYLSKFELNDKFQDLLKELINIIIVIIEEHEGKKLYQAELNKHLGLDIFFEYFLDGIKNGTGEQLKDNSFFLNNVLQIMHIIGIIKITKDTRNNWISLNNNRPEYTKIGILDKVLNHKTEDKLSCKLKKLFPNYTITKQFHKDWCKNIRELLFDFVIEELKIIIELDGGQHFRQISNWSPPDIKRDVYKMKCANENGYSVIRILQEDVYNDTYDWTNELKSNIEKIKKEKNIQNIYMCNNNEYNDHFIEFESNKSYGLSEESSNEKQKIEIV
jgi:very-short-patch-repair endonuclease